MAEIEPNEVAITFSTFYQTWSEGELTDVSDTVKVRGDLGLQFITEAHRAGYRVSNCRKW